MSTSFVLSVVGVAGCAIADVIGVAGGPNLDEGWPGLITRFGALGLCAYMVWAGNKRETVRAADHKRERTSLLDVIQKQQDELRTKNDEVGKLCVETLETIRKCRGPGASKEGEADA